MVEMLWYLPEKLLRLVPIFFPALFLALAIGLSALRSYSRSPASGASWLGFWRLFWKRFGLGSAVLLGGLVITGHDGRIATYAVLVLSLACLEWFWTLKAHRHVAGTSATTLKSAITPGPPSVTKKRGRS